MDKATHDEAGSRNGADAPDDRPLALVLSAADQPPFFEDAAVHSAGYALLRADSLAQAEHLCRLHNPAVVVMPLRLEGTSLLPYLAACKALRTGLRAVLVARNDEIDEAAEAMRGGVDDCLFLPFSSARLARTLRAMRSPSAPDPAPVAVAPPASEADRATYRGLIGGSPPMRRIFQLAETVAVADDPILIHGEVGTGKTSLARIVHAASPRVKGPLITLDCATQEQDDLSRQLHPANPAGALVRARAGTLFVDRLDELGTALQGRLLPLTDSGLRSQAAGLDVRLIVSMSRNPARALAEGRLREDLYYGLKVVTLALPPLRTRDADIGRLILSKIDEISTLLRRAPPRLDDEALQVLCNYSWPGNLSELVSTLRGILLTCGDTIGTDDLPATLSLDHAARWLGDAQAGAGREDVSLGLGPLIGRRLADIERAVIEATIAAEGGSVPRAAKVLDLSPSTIYRKRESWTKPGPQ